MRFVIVGVGAVGGTVAAELVLAGHEVLGVARGAHGRAIAATGLDYATPDAAHVLDLPVVASLSEARLTEDDVVMLAMKSQDTVAVLDELRTCAPPGVPVICLQNGVDNERQALRRFANVYGVCVMLPGEHLEPGVVRCFASPAPGILDIGRYPSGSDATSEAVAAALVDARFASESRPDIMRWKYRKLLMNLGNAIGALLGTGPERAEAADLAERVVAEGSAALAAAGIDVASEDEDRARRGDIFKIRPVGDLRRRGGSTWQSIQRGTPIETDYLSGEIVLLGRLHGVPTPANTLLQGLVAAAAAGTVDPDDVTAASISAALAGIAG